MDGHITCPYATLIKNENVFKSCVLRISRNKAQNVGILNVRVCVYVFQSDSDDLENQTDASPVSYSYYKVRLIILAQDSNQLCE